MKNIKSEYRIWAPRLVIRLNIPTPILKRLHQLDCSSKWQMNSKRMRRYVSATSSILFKNNFGNPLFFFKSKNLNQKKWQWLEMIYRSVFCRYKPSYSIYYNYHELLKRKVNYTWISIKLLHYNAIVILIKISSSFSP